MIYFIFIKLFFIALLFLLSKPANVIEISDFDYPKPDDPDYTYVPIYTTNDIHGKIFPLLYTTPDGKELYESGGVEYLYKYLQILREEWGEKNILWLDGGDQFQGGYEFISTNANILHDFYDYAKPHAMAIGNHEFDLGIDFLKNFLSKSKINYLSANIYENGKPISWTNVKESDIFYLNDNIAIGVIGLTTILTPSISSIDLKSLDFKDYKEIVVSKAKEMKDKGVNAVVLLAHLGPKCSNQEEKFINQLRSKETPQKECDDTQEINILLKSLPEGLIDAVVAAHVHDLSHHWIEGVPVVQTDGTFNAHIMYLPFNKSDGKLAKEKIVIEGPLPSCKQIFNVSKRCDNPIKEGQYDNNALDNFTFHNVEFKIDLGLYEKLNQTARDEVKAKLDSKIIEYNEEILTTDSFKDTVLTNLINDIARRVTGADVAFYNLGGLRSNWYPGSINEIDIFYMFPFSNKWVSFEMTGREVKRMLSDLQSGGSVYPTSGIMQVLEFTKNKKVKLHDVTIFDGYIEKPIDLDKNYTITTNDFLATGGSGFGKVVKWYKMRNYIEYGIVRELVTEYLGLMKKICKNDNWVDPEHPRARFLPGKEPIQENQVFIPF